MAIGNIFGSASMTDGESMMGMSGFETDFVQTGVWSNDSIALFDIEATGGGSASPASINENGVMDIACIAGGTTHIFIPGLPFRLHYGKKMAFGARINLQDFDATSYFVGLAVADNEIVAGVPSDMVGFFNDEEDGTIDTISRAGSSSTRDEQVDQAFTANDQWRELKVTWDGQGRIKYYINGLLVQLYTSTMPTNVPMRFVMEVQSATAENLWVDWAYLWQER